VNHRHTAPIGWDHPETARYYEAFCRRHDRYGRANRELVRHAALRPEMRCLDLAAGTGRTAEAALPKLGPEGRVLCVEPAGAMRAAGRARLKGDARVVWRARWPAARGGAAFDRVLSGAGIWQLENVGAIFRRIARLLPPGGAFVFTIPSLYLGEPDQPGGGTDPLVLALPGRIAGGGLARRPPAASAFRADAATIDAWLRRAGFEPVSWRFRLRLTQRCFRDWLKIPVLTDHLLPHLAPRERAAAIDRAFAGTDAASWKWERWAGWTAWRR